VSDIEDFLVRRNFRLAGIGDFFLLQFRDVATVAISHKRNYPNFGYRSERKEREKIQECCFLLATYWNLVCEYGDLKNKIIEIQRRWHIEKNHLYESDL
jgi:hypothetical protein